MSALRCRILGPLKTAWRNILLDFKLQNPDKSGLPKDVFPRLLTNLMSEMESNASKCLQSGFRKSEIYPLDREEVLKSLPTEIQPQPIVEELPGGPPI